MSLNKKPLVSIIIPVFNREKQITNCLISISKQTYTNFEVLIVDDGSTDKTQSVCRDWTIQDNRFFVFHQKNKGPSAARNLGLRKSRGTYIYFVDSDDWLEPNLLEQMIKCALATNSQVVFLQYNLISGTTRGKIANTRHIQYPSQNVLSSAETLKLLVPDKLPSFTWSFMSEKELFYTPESIEFPDFNLMEDQAILYKLVCHAKQVGFVHEKLYNYVVEDNSLLGTQSKSTEMCRSCILLAQERQDYMDSRHPELRVLTTNANMSLILTAYHILEENNNIHDRKLLKKKIKTTLREQLKHIGFKNLTIHNKIRLLFMACHLTLPAIKINKLISHTGSARKVAHFGSWPSMAR